MRIVKYGENYLTCLKEEGFGKYYCETTMVRNDSNIMLFKVKEDAEHAASVIGGTVVKTTDGMNEKQKDIYESLKNHFDYTKWMFSGCEDNIIYAIYLTIRDYEYDINLKATDTDFIPSLQAFLREVEAERNEMY